MNETKPMNQCSAHRLTPERPCAEWLSDGSIEDPTATDLLVWGGRWVRIAACGHGHTGDALQAIANDFPPGTRIRVTFEALPAADTTAALEAPR